MESIDIDMEVLQIAIFLHDVDQPYDKEKGEHVSSSMETARKILQSIEYPEEKIETVIAIISEHSSENKKDATTIESKILYDADKLDGTSQSGIARTFMLCGQQGMTVLEACKWYRKKIQKSLPLKTETGRRLVRKDLETVFDFLETVEKKNTFRGQ